MFSGFERGTFEFFMALGFNNNREFFHANHDWYERCVRDPLRELCMDLAPALLAIDPELEVRPARVISHINRDLRYSRDKSPYRDYMWLGFHRAGMEKSECFHFYFDIGVDGAHVGAGMYGDDRRWTNALRRSILDDSDGARDVLTDAALAQFTLDGGTYKRLAPPEGLDPRLAEWYPRKGVYVQRAYRPEEIMTPDFLGEAELRIKALKPLYDLMYRIKPAPEAGPDEYAPDDNFRRISAKSAYAPDTPDGY